MKNYLILTTVAAMAFTMQAQDPKLVPFNVGNDSFVNGMSANGKWGTYQRQAGEETVTFDVQLVDLSTGKFISYTPQKMINYQGREVSMPAGSYSQPYGVSNDGKIVYGCVNGYPAYFTVEDLTWHHLSMGSAANNRNLAGAVYGMSADGKKMAGWFAGTDLTTLKSALWVDGEIQELPNLPSYKDLYDRGIIDRTDFNDQKDLIPNYTFRKIAEDGSILLLGIDHNRPQWGCSYGVYDLNKDTFSFILAPAEYGDSFTDTAYMSENGEWVTGNMYFIGKDANGNDDYDGVYRYNVPTGKLEIFNDLQSRDLLATAIDNNGVIFAASPGSQPIRNLMVRCDNLWVELGKTLDQKYDINFTATTGYETTGYAVGVANDCKTALVQAEFRGGAYALTLPVNFEEAAKGTSLLTEYMVSPVSGKKFSKLSEMMIRFTYGAVPAKDASIVVTDDKGNVVGKSKNITSFSAQNLLYTVSFPDINLEEGVTYTVNVPAGTFNVEGAEGMGNPEITVKYTGRENSPVKVSSVNPQDGAFINVFSNSSPVTLTFDSDLSGSTAVQAKLYEEGKTAAICNLSATIDGNKLNLYPASERRLAKDKKYTVEIPAGLVSDLSGVGANEAMKYEYMGAYVPQLTTDMARPFFEDFNEPNEALYHFLMIDGDGNVPTEAMQGVGFDQYNTPWNFSVRDEGNYDYCAASHSSYSPAGQSDDWMVIPQLSLSDGDYFLTFKGQSYLKNKKDILKIVVWECDDVLGSMDAETLAKMKKESKTLTEVQLVAGQNEGQLEGSWIDYEFPLSDYAGKKIYIGFVNENRDQSMIFIDDLAVEYRGAYTLAVAAENNLIEAEKTNIIASVNVNAAGPFNELKAEISAPASDYKKTIDLKDLNLTTSSVQTVEFNDVPLVAGEINEFTVTTTIANISQSYTGKITNHAFEINRRVLVEEGTGMWCGNCPLGEVAIEHLEETMPDNVAIISVHNGDALALTDYDTQLALGAYPNGRINRSTNVYAPLDTSNGVNYTSESGDKTFMDAILSELSNGTEGEIKIVNPVYYSADNLMSIPIDVRFSVSRENAIYNVFLCVVEDGLSGRQSNYFTNTSDPMMSWWSAQPTKVSYTYNNVARAMVGGFYGFSGMVPTSIKSGEIYNKTLTFDLPSDINTDNMHFVVALIDATTGLVANSDVCRVFDVNDIPGANVEDIISDNDSATVTVKNGSIFVNGDDNVEVYTTSGIRVANANLAEGLYIARKQLSDKAMFSKLVMVK